MPERNTVNRVVIQTPSRLHIGLLDLNGEIGRIDGGLGLGLLFGGRTVDVDHRPLLTEGEGDEYRTCPGKDVLDVQSFAGFQKQAGLPLAKGKAKRILGSIKGQ